MTERLVDVNGDHLGFINSVGEIIPKKNFITERIKYSFKMHTHSGYLK